jgi:hypothetical protein
MYSSKWASHRESCEQLKAAILKVDDRLAVEYGFGADEKGAMPNADHAPNEPDLFIRMGGEVIGAVEVSGSLNAHVPPNDILIRVGKFEHAFPQNYLTWFWMVYPARTVVLMSSDVFYCRNGVTSIKGDREPYIRVPYYMARPIGDLFDWLRECLRLYGRTKA